MIEGIVGVIVLGALGGGGIIVIDWLVIRKVRRLAAARGERSSRDVASADERTDKPDPVPRGRRH